MNYIVTVTTEEMEQAGRAIVANHISKFPIDACFGIEGTRIFRIPKKEAVSEINVGEKISLSFATAMARDSQIELFNHEDSYVVVSVLYAASKKNYNELTTCCIEKINFPPTDLVVDYDNRLKMLQSLYPEHIVLRVRPEIESIKPGDTIVLHNSVLGGRWEIMLEDLACSAEEFSKYISNLEKDNVEYLSNSEKVNAGCKVVDPECNATAVEVVEEE